MATNTLHLKSGTELFCALAVLIAFSIIVVAVNGHYIFITLNDTLFVDGFKAWPQDSPDVFSVYNVAVAGLTLLTLPVM